MACSPPPDPPARTAAEKPAPGAEAGLVLDLDGFAGPIDLLLALARAGTVDLAKISILQLADQYLDFVRRARPPRLEIAADYLVMAAWLAWLKSRLLLPEDGADPDEPDPAELAEALALRLRRLDAMRRAAGRLMARDLLGRDVFARGMAEGVETVAKPVVEVTLHDLLAAWAGNARARARRGALRIRPGPLFGLDEALRRLSALVGGAVEWTALARFLPPPAGAGDGLQARSQTASTFAAALELARRRRVEIRQSAAFGSVFLRLRPPGTAGPRRDSV